MFEYVLVVVFYAGTMSASDSSSMITIPGFHELQGDKGCYTAGKQLKEEFETFKKSVKYSCVRVN